MMLFYFVQLCALCVKGFDALAAGCCATKGQKRKRGRQDQIMRGNSTMTDLPPLLHFISGKKCCMI